MSDCVRLAILRRNQVNMEVRSSGILGVKKAILPTKRNSEDAEPVRKRRLLSADSFCFSLEDITSHLNSKHDVAEEDSSYENDFCFWCDAKRYQESFKCPYHKVQPSVKDQEKQKTKKPYAYQDIPNMLQLYTTNTPNGERTGVRTVMQLPAGAWIGPYEGKLVKKDEVPMKNNFMWEIFQDGNLHGYIDGSDENMSSWMRFIKRANSQEEQNLWAFQYQDKIFYRANRTILPGQELIVWYDQEYTKYSNDMSVKNSALQTKKGNQSMTPNVESLSSHRSQKVAGILHKTSEHTGTIQMETSSNRIGALVSSPTKLTDPTAFPQLSRGKTETTPSKPVPRVSTGFSLKITDNKLTGRTDDYSPSSPQSPASPISSDSGCSFGLDSPTKSETNETWRCGQCHQSFFQRAMLQVHVCANAPFKPFKCGHCDKSFTTAGEMRAHAVIHQGKKPFKCGYCARSFTGATTLNNHIRIHTGEKPFKCEKCGKIFSQGSQLSKHEKIPGDCIPRTNLN